MLIELSCLAIDTVITSACYYAYKRYLNLHNVVKEAATSETKLDPSLITLLQQSPEALPYICISGQVRISGHEQGLTSQYKEGIVGVLQKLVTKEHKTQRVQGYWTDFHRIVRDALNVIPFCISRGDVSVHVTEPLESRFINDNLTVTHDVYKPKPGTMFIDRLFGDVSKGFRDTEKMLKIGTTVLGFGRLILDSGALRLEKPEDPSTYIITSLSKPELIRALQEDVRLFKILTGIFGCTGLLIGLVCAKKFVGNFWNGGGFANNNNDNEDTRFIIPIREARRRRRVDRLVADVEDRPVEHQCVVCLNKPREIVLLECGHVCICADCAEELFHPTQIERNNCPICRARVTRIRPIFIA